MPENVINQASIKEEVFKKNCFNLNLRTHKLHGKEKNHWAFWVDYKYRIKFIFLSDEEVLFLDIRTFRLRLKNLGCLLRKPLFGTHEIYK